jgi:hypothetical protein
VKLNISTNYEVESVARESEWWIKGRNPNSQLIDKSNQFNFPAKALPSRVEKSSQEKGEKLAHKSLKQAANGNKILEKYTLSL